MVRLAVCLMSLGSLLAGCMARQDFGGTTKSDWSPHGGLGNAGPRALAEAPPAPAAERSAAAAAAKEPSSTTLAVEPRKVIYTGEFQVVVADVGPSIEAARKIAEQSGGYMQRMTSSGITFRVPAQKFDAAVAALEKIGTVTSRNVVAQDVTEQYADLQIRLTNSKALLEKLRALLDKAPDVKTSLEIEREMTRVRTEIEQMEGQLARLQGQVAFATLTVDFISAPNAPSGLKANLPFYWLHTIGLESLLSFPGASY